MTKLVVVVVENDADLARVFASWPHTTGEQKRDLVELTLTLSQRQ